MTEPCIFKSEISPQDIVQGDISTCYFLSAVAALAEIPKRIRNLFLVTDINREMYFCLRILYKGEWKLIHLDEMIPCFADSHRMAFSRTTSSGLWVSLLEKAWAKLHGGYKRIECGYIEEGLHDLTGAPVKKYNLQYYSKSQ